MEAAFCQTSHSTTGGGQTIDDFGKNMADTAVGIESFNYPKRHYDDCVLWWILFQCFNKSAKYFLNSNFWIILPFILIPVPCMCFSSW